MYDLTASAWDLGLVGLFQFVPALVLALALLAAHLGAHDSRALLLGLSLVLGAVRAFQMPAQQSLTPLLVPTALLARAMAFSSAGQQAAIIGGPALGGLLFVAGMGVVYAANLGLFGVAALLAARLRYAHAPPPREPVTAATLLAGVRFIWQRKPVLGAVSLDLFAMLLGGAVALLPLYAKEILHAGPWGLGLLRGALAVSGAADMVNVVIRQTLVPLETPDAMRGRVSAVHSIFIGASNQLGEFESGATAALLGPVGTILVALAWFRLFPQLAGRDRIEPRNGS